jgi:hypothetical protein
MVNLIGEIEGGCLCNVCLPFYGYPFVSGAGRHFVESKSNSKICTYIKTYFSLYDLSLQFRSGQSRARWGGGLNRVSGWSIGCRLILRRANFK